MDELVVEYRLDLKGEGVKSADQFYRFVDVMANAATTGSEEVELRDFKDTSTSERLLKHRGTVRVKEYREDSRSGLFSLHLPAENFDQTHFDPTLIHGVIAGDMLGHPEIKEVKILTVEIPISLRRHIKGPRVGLDGVKEIFHLGKRPLLAFTVKPRLGLNAEEHAGICYAAMMGGVDLAEDDERLVNPAYCQASERVKRCVEAAAEATEKTSAKKMYSVNLTAREDRLISKFEELDEIAKRINGVGLECVKIDVPPVSFGGLLAFSEYLHSKARNVIVTVYPEFYWFYRRVFPAGWFLRLLRWCGADIVYAGTPVILEHFGEKGKTPSIVTAKLAEVKQDIYQRTLWNKEEGMEIQCSMPTVTGRVFPVTLDLLYTFLGGNIGFFVGGGILKHPQGIEAGARMCRAALEVAVGRKRYTDVFKEADVRQDKEIFGLEYIDPRAVLRQDPELRRFVEVAPD